MMGTNTFVSDSVKEEELMADQAVPTADLLREFEAEATKVLEHAQEAAQHYAKGDKDWALKVASLSHYKLSSAEAARDGVIEALEAEGARLR